MPSCAVLDDYQRVASRCADWERLAPLDVTFLHELLPPGHERATLLSRYDVIVAMRERTPFPDALLGSLPNLRLLVSTGMRNAAVDLASARRHGILVCGTIGRGRGPAELTWALILAAARRLPLEMANMRAGRWQTTVGLGLHERTLGIVGLGTVGGQVAGVARAFGMRVLAWSPNLTEARTAEIGVERAADLAALLRASDVVSLHATLNPSTRGLIGAGELALMKPTAILVNTSRGPLVDRPALVQALRAGAIAWAAVDVYDEEPLPPVDTLRDIPNLIATPHLGYVTDDNYAAHYESAVEAIRAWQEGKPVRVLTA